MGAEVTEHPAATMKVHDRGQAAIAVDGANNRDRDLAAGAAWDGVWLDLGWRHRHATALNLVEQSTRVRGSQGGDRLTTRCRQTFQKGLSRGLQDDPGPGPSAHERAPVCFSSRDEDAWPRPVTATRYESRSRMLFTDGIKGG